MEKSLTIGIVGGMSPESTAIYYQHIVRRHQIEFHNHSYPRIIVSSVSFQQYIDWQHEQAWQKIAQGLEQEFGRLAAAGADFAVLATNTMHKVLPSIKSPIPVLSVLDVVADYCRRKDLTTIGLTGTRFTMSDGFYSQGLESRGLNMIIPGESQQDEIHRIIYEELIAGRVMPVSIEAFMQIAKDLYARGAQTILLGCTELVMLIEGNRAALNMIDSTRLHAEAAWKRAIGREDS